MIESRLKSSLKKRAYHNIVLAVLGVLAIIIILVVFGTKILIGFSLLTERGNGNDAAANVTKTTVYVAPPILNPVVDATNSAQIAVSGKGLADQTIKIYVNGNVVDDTTVQDDNNFNFASVHLQSGQNTIKAIALDKDKNKSDYSNELTISMLNKAPELTVNQPQDGQGFDRNAGPVSILGQTDPGAQVTINDFVAIVDDQGKFSYLYNLKDGDNDLKINATDDAGNKTTKELHIHTN
jgi:bacillopeptidase F